MTTLKLYHDDNILSMYKLLEQGTKVQAIYADCIYELDIKDQINWINPAIELLDKNGIIYIQTDYHSVAEIKLYLDSILGKENFVNWLIYIQEWGGTSKRFFPRKHDDILMYTKGKDYKFYPDRIQIEKATKGTAFDKKGTGLKTPCDVFYDLGNFSTVSKERIKLGDKNIRWQKPMKLMKRLLLPVTDDGDTILDPFMGSGSTGIFCREYNRNFIGIENNLDVFELARKRIDGN